MKFGFINAKSFGWKKKLALSLSRALCTFKSNSKVKKSWFFFGAGIICTAINANANHPRSPMSSSSSHASFISPSIHYPYLCNCHIFYISSHNFLWTSSSKCSTFYKVFTITLSRSFALTLDPKMSWHWHSTHHNINNTNNTNNTKNINNINNTNPCENVRQYIKTRICCGGLTISPNFKYQQQYHTSGHNNINIHVTLDQIMLNISGCCCFRPT